MESQDSKSTFKPTKRFLVRGGIATSIILLILIVQTNWFLGLFNKKTANIAIDNATVGEIVGRDSNGNGIADWEERLWGLDPNVASTNGVSNKIIIENKRKNLRNGTSEEGPLNETDKLAREIFILTNAIGGEGSASKDTLSALASKLGSQGIYQDILPVYGIQDIKTISTNRKNLLSYKNSVLGALSTYKKDLPELNYVLNSLETGDYSKLNELEATSIFYKNLAKKIIKISPPVSIAQQHLDITNSIIGISNSLEKIKQMEDNGILALVGLSEYRYHDKKLIESLEKLSTYLTQYGII